MVAFGIEAYTAYLSCGVELFGGGANLHQISLPFPNRSHGEIFLVDLFEISFRK